MEIQLVRFAVAIFFCLATGLAYVVWRNAAAPDALTNIGIGLAALLPVTIAIFPYFVRETYTHSTDIVFIHDMKTDQMTFGKNLGPYDLTMGMFIVNLSKAPANTIPVTRADFSGEKGLDLVERGIIMILALNFQSVWDFKIQKHRLPSMESHEYVPSTSEPGTVITEEQVKRVFRHNPILAASGLTAFDHFMLPPNSTIESAADTGRRIITVSNDSAQTTLTIRYSGGGVAQHGVTGVVDSDPSDINRYWITSFRIDVKVQSRWLRRHAPDMPGNIRWFNAVSELVRQPSWEGIEEAIEKRR